MCEFVSVSPFDQNGFTLFCPHAKRQFSINCSPGNIYHRGSKYLVILTFEIFSITFIRQHFPQITEDSIY